MQWGWTRWALGREERGRQAVPTTPAPPGTAGPAGCQPAARFPAAETGRKAGAAASGRRPARLLSSAPLFPSRQCMAALADKRWASSSGHPDLSYKTTETPPGRGREDNDTTLLWPGHLGWDSWEVKGCRALETREKWVSPCPSVPPEALSWSSPTWAQPSTS